MAGVVKMGKYNYIMAAVMGSISGISGYSALENLLTVHTQKMALIQSGNDMPVQVCPDYNCSTRLVFGTGEAVLAGTGVMMGIYFATRRKDE